MLISEHFTDTEIACPCCGAADITKELLTLAEAARALLGGLPFIVHSGVRCRRHNAAIGGAPESLHLTGRALDFHVAGMPTAEAFDRLAHFYATGQLPDLGGLGLYNTHIHIDTGRPKQNQLRIWTNYHDS